mmetsp:Transcript_13206/g.15155  ORF Transcript_13206/g.15155 Transcript_13206/m.15155 type:complete len:409 (-) Transcript_13206:73-1299(-)
MTVNVSYSTKAKSLLSGSIDFLDISEDQCLDDKEEKFANNHFNPPLHKLHRQRPLDCREKFDVVVSGSKKYNFLFSSSRDESVLQESMEKEDYCIYDSSRRIVKEKENLRVECNESNAHKHNNTVEGTGTSKELRKQLSSHANLDKRIRRASPLSQSCDLSASQASDSEVISFKNSGKYRKNHPPSSHGKTQPRSPLKSILRVINSKRQNQIRKNTSKKLARISACPDHNVSSNNVAIDVIDGSLRKTKFSSSETYVVPHSSKFNKGQNLHLTAPLSTSADITGMFDERQYSHDDTSDYKRNTCQTEGQRKMKSSHSLTTLITSQVPVSRNNSSRSRKNKGYTSSDLFQRHKPQDICRMIQRKSKLRSVKSLDIQDSKFQTTMVIPDYSNYVLRSVQKFKRNLLKLYF